MNTLQQEFDIIVKHLFTQGAPAKRDGPKGGCYYRFHDGDGNVLSCAVGCRIPDDKYQKSMDTEDADWGDTDFYSLIQKFPKGTAGLPLEFYVEEYQPFYKKIQEVHDLYAEVDNEGKFILSSLIEVLQNLAEEHELKLNIPNIE